MNTINKINVTKAQNGYHAMWQQSPGQMGINGCPLGRGTTEEEARADLVKRTQIENPTFEYVIEKQPFAMDHVETDQVRQGAIDAVNKAKHSKADKGRVHKADKRITGCTARRLTAFQHAELDTVKLTKADAAKCKHIRVATAAAHANGSCHLANSLHHVRGGADGGFVRKDRIAAIANAIDKFSRLNPKVLKGGQALKDALIAEAWQAYAHLEQDGTDNAHFTETQIPMDERQDIARDDDTHGFNNECYKWAERTASDDCLDD